MHFVSNWGWLIQGKVMIVRGDVVVSEMELVHGFVVETCGVGDQTHPT